MVTETQSLPRSEQKNHLCAAVDCPRSYEQYKKVPK